jgi:hypothetical protein
MVGRIDLFQQIKMFDQLCLTELANVGITGNHRSVYYALLSINNSKHWSEVFEVDFQYIKDLSRVDKDTYRKAMDFFNDNGLFDSYVKGVNHYARAKVSLKVLTEIPLSTSVGASVSNPVGKGVTTSVGSSVSGEHTIKTVNNKQKIKKERGVAPAPTDFNEIFILFKEYAADDNWTETFCSEKAKKFFETYKSKWPDDWKAKVRSWIITEKNPVTKDDATVSSRVWPNTYDADLDRTLSQKEHQQYGSHLLNKCGHFTEKDHLGKFLRYSPKNKVQVSNNNSTFSELSKGLANKLSNPIVVPKPTYPDLTIPKSDD